MGNQVKVFEVFFDGDCPLCMREIRMLKRMDKRATVEFTDIADPQFEPPIGFSHKQLMASIHGRLATGEMVDGVEVFRQLYTAVGFGPVVKLTRLPGIRQLLDVGYKFFAKNRLRLTGRCEDGSCKAPKAA
jgi:predicted DCC family thiol-disulfide oxidoreductase YuxK